VKAPRLIGMLIDLPAAALLELASRWGCPATPKTLPLDDLLGRVALGRASAERSLLELGGLGLVARVGPSGRAQPLQGRVGRDWLAVPREVAAALSRAAAAR
jgi:hypothetical protein